MTDGNTSFVDRDMYMRFRGGGVGHVTTRIEDPEPEVTIVDPEPEVTVVDPEPEVTIVDPEAEGGPEPVMPPVLGDEVEGDAENEDQDSDLESEDESNGRGDDEDEIGDDDDLEEQDDTEGLGIDELGQSLREVILDDLGFSEL